MIKVDRAINKSELLTIVNNSEGIYLSTLQRFLGAEQSTLHRMLEKMVKKGTINKVNISKNIYYTNKYDLSKVEELDYISKIVYVFQALEMRQQKVNVNNKYRTQYVSFNNFKNAVLKDKKDIAIISKFRVYKTTFDNINEYNTLNTDSLDILIIDDLDLINKIIEKTERKGVTTIRKDILIFVESLNQLYTMQYQNNALMPVLINDSKDFLTYYNQKNKKIRISTNKNEIRHYNKYYRLKEQNLKKYSKNKGAL